MKKKVLSLLLALLILICSTPLTLMAATMEADDTGSGDVISGIPLVSIEPIERHTMTSTKVRAPAKPDASGYANFIIKATGAITGDITVYYETEDLSAIAQAGDYEEKIGSVVLTRENPEVQISIKTSRADYSINLNIWADQKGDGEELNSAYISRSFLVKLTGVEGNAVLDKDTDPDDGIDMDNTQVECALLAEHSLVAYKFWKGDTVLAPYTFIGKYEIKNIFNTETCSSGESVYNTAKVNFPISWSADYMSTGIDAKLYMSIRNAHIDESWWNSSSGIYVAFADMVVYMYGEFHDNEDFGWGAAFLYAATGIKGTISDSKRYENAYEENYSLVRWHTFDGTRVALSEYFLHENLKNVMSKNYVIRRDWSSYGLPSATATDIEDYYISVKDELVEWTEMEVKLHSNGGYSRQLTGGDLSFRLEDIIAPSIEIDSDGNYAIYHNFDTATVGDKLRVAIRFNEPVQVEGKVPYFTGKINGVGSGIEPHPYAVKFNYVGGSGTDTLYFEAEYNGDYHITSITDINFKYADSIKDYAGVANKFTPAENMIIDGFNLDKREPIISVSTSDSKMSSFGKSKPVSVTVSNISEEATLYYAWTNSVNPPASFEKKLTVTGTLSRDYATVPVMGEGDGETYLHLKAVSRYGKVQTRILVVSSGNVGTQNYLGPYKFDNSPPTVNEEALLPKVEGSSPNQKLYVIPLPKDVGAGFSELKMYYVGEDGKDYLISGKTLTPDSFKNGEPAQIVLDAADVGLDYNDRRTVTLFFTLTDAIGNIDGDVARHSVTFDTHSYIDVEYGGATKEFLSKTEVIDEVYTLIYSGNPAEYNREGIYYSFEFKVLNKNINGNTIININKNGSALTEGYKVHYPQEVEDAEAELTFKIDFTAPMGEGYYDIQIYSYEEETSVESGPDRFSMPYRLYVGSGKGKLDEKVNVGTVLINKIYQLPTASYFYYMDNNYTIDSVVKELYNGTSLPASFSSKEGAYEYALFNEYRDLYAVTLSAELAEALNLEISNAQKASGETTVAREGQVWIRYKSAEWSPDSPFDKTKWVYYYYGSSEKLDAAYFSQNLQSALKTVSENIVSRGSVISLPNLSGFNGESITALVSKIGPPTLAAEQVHATPKVLSGEKCNSQFDSEVIYQGDAGIYSSTVMIGGVEYVLLGNVTIPEGIRFQYKRIDESGKEDREWTELEFMSGQCFGDVLNESGKYKIRELSSGGVSTFNIYIDKDAPMLLVSWKGKDGSSNSQILSKYSETDFRSKSLRIVGIDAREYDKYSYVALYKVSNFELCGVYAMTDLQKTSIDVPDGDYYMVVSDRSGNSYVMTLHINSSELKCDIKESENIKIRFTCDRKASQIQDFYVKRNGILVSAKYATELDFTESGVYEIYVKDIYGNVFGPEFYDFERVYPEVEWKYRDESGHYVSYDAENKVKQFSLERVTDGAYTISTSVGMKFKITGDYGYTFLGTAPQYEENLNDSTVTIKTTQVFQLKVYYKKHPDVYTIYNCVADVSAPVIDASIQVDSPMPDEIAELRDALANGTVVKEGDKLIPSKISYSSNATEVRHIVNNDIVVSDFVKVTVSDESGISYVKIYRNGELFKEQAGEGFNMDIALTRTGEYKIIAEDALGNKSEFNFTNDTPESLIYVVDGLPYKLGLRDFENFDGDGNYMDTTFGNNVVAFVISEHIKVFYMITDSEGQKHFVAFDVNGMVVSEAYYTVDENNNVILEISSEPLFDGNNPKVVKGTEYVIYEVEKTGAKIYAMVNAKGEIVLSTYASDVSSVCVEARLNTEDSEFHYTKTELSSYSANLKLETSEGVVEFTEAGDLIKFNRPFTVSEADFEADKIFYAEVYYSKTNDFNDLYFVEKEYVYEPGKYYETEGFYLVRLVNLYGIESIYIVHISYKFDVAAYSEFSDGAKIYFSTNYEEVIHSNNKVVFEVYANDVDINVTKDEKKYQPVISISGGITYVILSEDGEYKLSFSDSYKNTIERSASINSPSKSFNEDLLVGYNENALKRAEGYTNQKLSINKDVFDKEGICYLEIQYGDTVNLLYDSISEDKVDLDESKLTNCIGDMGDGVYTVTMRNKYGAVLTKVIHYRGTPTLTLEREIRSSLDPEIYDINQAMAVGFWSNSSLIFKSDAENYVFTINGDKTECPKTLSFMSADQQGRAEYDITYIDEYGFSYSFKAYLVRQNLEMAPELSVDGQYIDGTLTTTGNFLMNFSENAICTYTWNNSEEKVYTKGQVISQDGVYRFIVTDYAGNATAFTVKKDTIVEFAFTETGSSTPIESGSVINSSKVSFTQLNGDSAYIEKVFKNGVLQESVESSKFSEDGKWEMIISDKLGNKSYYCFYIVTKQKDKFAYTTPYEYHVTELWYDSGDGVQISYLKFVNQGEISSSFEFVENGKYSVVMTSAVSGVVSKFEFTINTNAPAVSLVGCNAGETTIHDVTLSGCIVGDTIKIYRATDTGEELVSQIEVTSNMTKMPIITEGGSYRVVVESEAGVATELSFVRKHVMNTEGSIFIMIMIGVAVVGLFTGLVYRNKSKTDK